MNNFITVCDPYICLANRPFYGRNHENDPGPGPDPLDEGENAHGHARSVHEVEETSRPSRCADDDDIAGAATPGGLCHNRRGRHRVDRRPCENEVVAMATGCHRACVAAAAVAASPDGDGAVEMVSDCHLAHGGGNPACNDGAGRGGDDGNGGRASHLMHQNHCLNRNRTR
jgi:hypothetical protein